MSISQGCATSDAAVVGVANMPPDDAAPMPAIEETPDFGVGEWVHVELTPDGEVLNVHRPPTRSWHEVVDKLLIATLVARRTENIIVGDLYTSTAMLRAELARREQATQDAAALRPRLKELLRGRR